MTIPNLSGVMNSIAQKYLESFLEILKQEGLDFKLYTVFPVRLYYSWLNNLSTFMLASPEMLIIDTAPSTKTDKSRVVKIDINQMKPIVRKASFWEKLNINNADSIIEITLPSSGKVVGLFVELPGQQVATMDRKGNAELIRLLGLE